MGEKMYVKESLEREMIDSGRILLEELDREKMHVKAALWLYFEDSESWRLILALPQVGRMGPKILYEKIQKLFKKLRKEHRNDFSEKLYLGNVAIVLPDHPIVELLSSVIHTGSGIGGVRFSKNTINGTYIEDAYIYRLN